MKSPFSGILGVSIGDVIAKSVSFVAYLYLARVLGVSAYGILEFANSTITYFLLIGDLGLELWATREAAHGRDIRELAYSVVRARLLLAIVAFLILLFSLPAFPEFPQLRIVLTFFGLSLFTQAVNLKWAFLGREKMRSVVTGLLLAQAGFALGVFAVIRTPDALMFVPVCRVLGDVIMVGYFGRRFIQEFGWPKSGPKISMVLFRPALVLGAAHALATMNYNFDSVLLGFLAGPAEVGLYNAAYKPVTIALALPVSYFRGLLPVLSRMFVENRDDFRKFVSRSIHWALLLSLPLGVEGTFLARPVIHFLFGVNYARSAEPLQILCWSAVLVILRGTYRQALTAAGKQHLDLRSALFSTASNIGLNFILIPMYGIVGAAVATLLAEMVWFTLAVFYFDRNVDRIQFGSFLIRPAIAVLAMAAFFLVAPQGMWVGRAMIALLIYFGILILLNEEEVRALLPVRRNPIR